MQALGPRSTRWTEYGRPAVLFVMTTVCIYLQGAARSDGFGLPDYTAWADGLRLVAGVLGIVVAHEMGHYLACRYYGVDATLPHLLPAPALSLVGTFGAFIRIRSPFPHRRALFDIGVAGPLAGFAVCLPVLYLAALEIEPVTPTPGSLYLGEPWAFQLAMRWLTPAVDLPPDAVLGLGPLGLAAWFGLLLTALNLMPVGQLDGGHAVHALLPRHAWRVSRIASWVCVGLVYFSPSWILWAVLLRLLGRRHPPTLDDHAPVGRRRVLVGLLCLFVFAVCFTPVPIEIPEWSPMEWLS